MEKEKIKSTLVDFVKAWQDKDPKLLRKTVIEEPYAYFSTHENCYTVEGLEDNLFNFGENYNSFKIEVINEYSRVKGNKAVQYANVIEIFSDNEKNLAFGGSFCNKLEKFSDDWKFTEMRFELQTDSSVKNYVLSEGGILSAENGNGDLKFISKLKKVNTSIGLFIDPKEGEGVHTIMPECDAPWYLIDSDDEIGTDEEQIKEVLLKYFCAFDLNTTDLFDGVFSDDSVFESNRAGKLNMKDAVAYLSITRQASARSFHAVRFDSIEVDGNNAVCTATRLMPEKADYNQDISALIGGEYKLSFKKTDNKWQISKFAYRES